MPSEEFLQAQQIIAACANDEIDLARAIAGEIAEGTGAKVMLALAGYTVMMARLLSDYAAPPSGDNTPLGWIQAIGLGLARDDEQRE